MPSDADKRAEEEEYVGMGDDAVGDGGEGAGDGQRIACEAADGRAHARRDNQHRRVWPPVLQDSPPNNEQTLG